jgi:putative transcriptional regulator
MLDQTRDQYLSVLKNGHARALRFSTLPALCDALDSSPGDLITTRPIHSRH